MKPFIWISFVIITLFIGTANAQIPQTPYPRVSPTNRGEMDDLQKRIAKLEKIIKEHIDKPHIYFRERNSYSVYGYLYVEDCNGKQDKISH